MVTSHGLDPATCLELALSKLKYFPHIRYWDEKRHCKAKWNFRDYVELYQPSQVPLAASCAAAYQGDVCAKMKCIWHSHATSGNTESMEATEGSVADSSRVSELRGYDTEWGLHLL